MYLRKIDENMNTLEYEMYQDIPREETGSSNSVNGVSFEEYKNILKKFISEETDYDNEIQSTTTRYIFYVKNNPVGEIAIRTTLNDFWINKGSQIFYKIRESERGKGYGTLMLKKALEECKKIGFEKVRINCSDNNYPSISVIKNNGGTVDIKKYKTNSGTSSSYIIDLKK